MKKFWGWLRTRWDSLLVSAVLLFGAGLVYKHQKRKVGTLKDLLAVEQAQNEIIALRKEREMLARLGSSMQDDLATVDARIDARKRTIVAMHEDVQGLDTSQVADAFARLGY